MPPPSYYPCAWEVRRPVVVLKVFELEWHVGTNTGSGMVLSYWKWLHHNPNNRAVHADVAHTGTAAGFPAVCRLLVLHAKRAGGEKEQFLGGVLVYSTLSWVFLTSRIFTFKHFPSLSCLSEFKVSMHLFFSGNNDKSQFPHIIVTLSIIIASCSMCVFFGNALCTGYCECFHLIWECFLWLFCSCTMHFKRCHWWSLFTAVLLPFCDLGKHSGTNSETLCYFLISPVVSVPGMTTN